VKVPRKWTQVQPEGLLWRLPAPAPPGPLPGLPLLAPQPGLQHGPPQNLEELLVELLEGRLVELSAPARAVTKRVMEAKYRELFLPNLVAEGRLGQEAT